MRQTVFHALSAASEFRDEPAYAAEKNQSSSGSYQAISVVVNIRACSASLHRLLNPQTVRRVVDSGYDPAEISRVVLLEPV